jgi:hypothetical protein
MRDEARRHAAAPSRVFPTYPCGLEFSPRKKKQKMQIAPNELLKTKGKKRCSQ